MRAYICSTAPAHPSATGDSEYGLDYHCPFCICSSAHNFGSYDSGLVPSKLKPSAAKKSQLFDVTGRKFPNMKTDLRGVFMMFTRAD